MPSMLAIGWVPNELPIHARKTSPRSLSTPRTNRYRLSIGPACRVYMSSATPQDWDGCIDLARKAANGDFMPAKTHLKQATGGHVAFDYETQLHIGKLGKLAP